MDSGQKGSVKGSVRFRAWGGNATPKARSRNPRIILLGLESNGNAFSLGLFSAGRDSADEIFAWTLPASPTIDPTLVSPGIAFEIQGVPFWENGLAQGKGTFDFFNLVNGVGFELLTTSAGLILNEFGLQVYTGPAGNQESIPTFVPGTYQFNDGSPTGPLIGTLTITSGANGDLFTFDLATVPEPSSSLLIGSGALGLPRFARRKISV